MSAKEAYEIHALKLGKLIGNLLTIELAARFAIVKFDNHESQKVETLLAKIKTGDVVEYNAFTNKDDLNQTLKKYNKRVKNKTYKVLVDEIVDLRDALSHGRTFGIGNMNCLRLVKFSKKVEEKKVKVELAQDMDDAWFDKNIAMLNSELEKVRLSLEYEKKYFN